MVRSDSLFRASVRRVRCRHPVTSGLQANPVSRTGEGRHYSCRSLRGCSVALVDESAEPVVATDVAQSRCGEFGRIWRPETNTRMWSLRVVVGDVDAEDAFEVSAVDDQQPVETLLADGSNKALGDGIRSRRPYGCLHRPDVLASQKLVEVGAVLVVAGPELGSACPARRGRDPDCAPACAMKNKA